MPGTDAGTHKVPYALIVDDDVAAYIASEKITDLSGYVNGLVRQARERGEFSGLGASAARAVEDLSDRAPDTSGYPHSAGGHNGAR